TLSRNEFAAPFGTLIIKPAQDTRHRLRWSRGPAPGQPFIGSRAGDARSPCRWVPAIARKEKGVMTAVMAEVERCHGVGPLLSIFLRWSGSFEPHPQHPPFYSKCIDNAGDLEPFTLSYSKSNSSAERMWFMSSVPVHGDPGRDEDPAWLDRDPMTAAEREA